MAGSTRFLPLFGALLFCASSAHAHCGHVWYPNIVTYSYGPPIYYPPSPLYLAPPICGVWPIEPVRVVPAARPNPAPASTTAEPPIANPLRKAPTITESRSLGGSYAGVGPVLPRCKVGFWNLTGKDMTIRVDGKDHTLPKDRSFTLELDRQFTWQSAGKEPTAERVPEDQNAYEVIIRPTIE